VKKFLIQTINKEITFDFSFHLIEAIKYNNWYQNEKIYDYILSDKIEQHEEFIPVGSLEFVFEYINKYYNLNKENIKPINIPHLLCKHEYLQREVFIANKNNIKISQEMFVKSNTKYKSFADIIKDTESIPEDEYLISELIDIDSEWRGFVQNNKLVGLNNYSGDFKLFPNIQIIEQMINDYKDSPLSYTIDIGVNNNGTFLIEVHPFVSCGLYGFAEYKILPLMFIQGFKHMTR
jgi:hypothetical protein